jgi:hypothetical protein
MYPRAMLYFAVVQCSINFLEQRATVAYDTLSFRPYHWMAPDSPYAHLNLRMYLQQGTYLALLP